jgi:C-terminal processing protease CtpA/Prc
MNNTKKISTILLLFITFLTSFLLWALTKDKIDIYLEKYNVLEESWQKNFNIKNVLLNKDLDLTLFWQIYNIVWQNFYSSWEVDEKQAEYWLIKWYMSSLWDKFSEFMTPEETKDFEETLNWDFEWIW